MRMASMPIRIFVYGTLLSGEANHGLLSSARLIASIRTPPEYWLYDLGPYPALVMNGEEAVTGEIYEIDEGTLEELDRFEEHPDLYIRRKVTLGPHGDAFVYVIAGSLSE